ncbi:MAG TPA: hypothetical protein VI230_02690 [Ignavibacteriaceae bacterium]
MDRKDKIIELLEKDHLTDTEKKELDSLIGSDEELKEFASAYSQLSGIVSHSSHLNEEEISEYILFKNGAAEVENSIISRIPFIESHLRKCSECSNIFKDLNSEYTDVELFLSEKLGDVQSTSGTIAQPPQALRSRYRAPRYAFMSVLIIGFIYLSLYIISSFSTPAYYHDAALDNSSEFSINRGRATDNFQNSLKALERDNYDEAIGYLQKDIKQNPADETIFYSYYIIGLSYLETARHDYLGLFPGYDRERAIKGAEYLKESVRKNDSGKFTNIKLNSYFYLAKASMMLNDKKSAREYLSLVINEKGSKMEEAKKLLGELE